MSWKNVSDYRTEENEEEEEVKNCRVLSWTDYVIKKEFEQSLSFEENCESC